MNKKVSVIMGVYNCENTIADSIESILKQTYTNWEFIICDDCSTDNTYKVVSNYKYKYPDKIKLVRNDENKGLAYSLNHCLKYVTGHYVARQDGDDMSTFDRFEKQVKFLDENYLYSVVGTSMLVFDENGDKGIRKPAKVIPQKKDLLTSNPFAHATIMMRKEVYIDLNGYRVDKYTKRCEDADLWYRFFAKGYKGYNITEYLYKVREDEAAISRKNLKNLWGSIVTKYRGIKILGLNPIYNIYILKVILPRLMPRSILKIYYNIRLSNN